MMMDDDLESKMKEKLLEGLIEHMHGRMAGDMGAKFPQKAMEVSVAAPDEDKLKEGLSKASGMMDSDMGSDMEGSDEDRLMDLLEDDDKDKE